MSSSVRIPSRRPRRPVKSPAGPAGAVVALIALAGCGADAGAPATVGSAELPVWTADTADLTIGTLDGNAAEEFGSIQGVLDLPDGGLAVSDALTGKISVFGPDGRLLRTMGALGDGPGEFAVLSRIYAHGPDSITVLDPRRNRVSWFSLDGEYGRGAPAPEVSGESVYPMDVFPASRFILDGAADRESRVRVGRIVAQLPHPSGSSLIRLVKVASDGGLWVRETAGDSVTPSAWLVLDGTGAAMRWVHLPPGFTPFGISGDRVVGRRVGAYGVEYAERIALRPTDRRTPAPTWFSRPSTPDPAPAGSGERGDAVPTGDELRTQALASIKSLASGQEIFYSRNYRYANSLDELRAAAMPDGFELALPEGYEFRFLTAGSRGWSMVVAHPDLPVVCTLGYGLDTPPGWGTGSVDCGSADGLGGSPPPWATGAKPPAAPKG